MVFKALLLFSLSCLSGQLAAQLHSALEELPDMLVKLERPGDFIQLKIDAESRLSSTPDFTNDSLLSKAFDDAITEFLLEHDDKVLQVLYYSDSSLIRRSTRSRPAVKAVRYLKARVLNHAMEKYNLDLENNILVANYRTLEDQLDRLSSREESEDYLYIRLFSMNYVVTNELTGEKSVTDLIGKPRKAYQIFKEVLVNLNVDSTRNHNIEIYQQESNGSGNNLFLIEIYKGTEDHQIVPIHCDFLTGLEIVTQPAKVRNRIAKMKAEGTVPNSILASLSPDDIQEMVIIHFSEWCMSFSSMIINRRNNE